MKTNFSQNDFFWADDKPGFFLRYYKIIFLTLIIGLFGSIVFFFFFPDYFISSNNLYTYLNTFLQKNSDAGFSSLSAEESLLIQHAIKTSTTQLIYIHLLFAILFVILLILFYMSINRFMKIEMEDKRRFHTFMENSPALTFVKDQSGKLIYMNKAAENHLPIPYRNSNWMNKHDFEIWSEEEVKIIRKNDLEVLTSNKSNIYEESLFDGYNKYTWLTHKFPYTNAKGQTFVVGMEIDITDRKAAEEEIKKYADKLEKINKNKDRYFSILAHDLRSPFTSLFGYIELLVDNINIFTKNEINEYLHTLKSISMNQFQLLENLLDWSLLSNDNYKPKLKRINIFNEIQKAVNLYQFKAAEKSIKIIVSMDHSLEKDVDQHGLFAILRNLISNAIKFTPQNGQITISATRQENELVIKVADTGVGIEPNLLNKILDPLDSTSTRGTDNEKGTGLGLGIVSHLLNTIGGQLEIDSRYGMGSTFIIKI